MRLGAMRTARALRVLAGMGGAVLLSGCASIFANDNVGEDWNCEAQEGLGCKSISEIRTIVSRPGAAHGPVAFADSHGHAHAPAVTGELLGASVPRWTPDQVMMVRFSPYVDRHGNYHAASNVYAVVAKGGWALQEH